MTVITSDLFKKSSCFTCLHPKPKIHFLFNLYKMRFLLACQHLYSYCHSFIVLHFHPEFVIPFVVLFKIISEFTV